jgi:hypothetical protein
MAKKTAKQLKDLSRWELKNYYHLYVDNDLTTFLPTKIWNWAKNYIENRFGGKEDFRFYPRDGDNGVYPILPNNSEKTVIAIASDWATDTVDSAVIGQLMQEENPDYSLHLGDVYYVGNPDEVEANFGKINNNSDHGEWVNSKGFLALPGNHEFYSKGIGFYDYLLPKTKIPTQNNGVVKQKAGFFCLENDHWRIIGLDTGYTSVGIPVIEFVFPAKCELKDEQIAWLRDEVKLGDVNDKRGLIILSHHQYFSAFEGGKSFPKPAEQLAEIMGKEKAQRPVIWYWGHQHLLSFYALNSIGSGIKAYGRCIGHGGMPADIPKIETKTEIQCAIDSQLQFYDLNFQIIKDENQKEIPVGLNGFVKMTLDGDSMIAEHIRYEVNSEPRKSIVMTEKWTINQTNGILSFELTDDDATPLMRFSPN